MRRLRSFVLRTSLAAAMLGIAVAGGPARIAAQAPQGVVVRLGSAVTPQAVDGRLLLFLSKDARANRASK